MRTLRTLPVAAALPLVLAMAPSQQGAVDFGQRWRAVEQTFRAECARAGVVGAGLMFVRGGDVLGLALHGDADRSAGRKVDRDTIWHWASCTKTLTGIAALQLRDRGRLPLDRPIVELVPELRAVHDPCGPIEAITVRHLLTHSAGFRMATWPWGGDRPWHPHEPTRWSQLAAMMPWTEVEFAPGSRFSYSNPGIVFVGRAIEQLTGEDYEVHLEKNVLRPLGMVHSYFDVTPWHLQRHRSHSYAVEADGALRDRGADFDTGVTVSNGGLNAPLPDMARYLGFLLGAAPADSAAAAVLARSSLEEMWQPQLPTGREAGEHIGLCFFVHERDGQRLVGHTGGQRDFVSFFYVHPGSGTGAVAAFNTGTAGPAMAAVRRACIEQLSLPMTPPAEPAFAGAAAIALRRGDGGELRIVYTVPSGGHELKLTTVAVDGTTLVADLQLVTPGDGETATQALESLEVALPSERAAGCEHCLVRVSTWQRGCSYLVAPPYVPAARLRIE